MVKHIHSASVPACGVSRRSRTRLSAIHAKEKDTTRVHALAEEEENTNQKGTERETTAKEIGAKEEKEIGKGGKGYGGNGKGYGGKGHGGKGDGNQSRYFQGKGSGVASFSDEWSQGDWTSKVAMIASKKKFEQYDLEYFQRKTHACTHVPLRQYC